MERARRRCWILLAAGCLAACRPTVVASVAPWFRVEVTRPGYLPGHLIAYGTQREVAKVRSDAHWSTIAQGTLMMTWVMGGGRSVALRHDGGPLTIYSEAGAAPVVIPYDTCPIPEVTQDGERLLCVRCKESRGPSMRECREIAVREFDARGRPLRDWQQSMPEAVRGPCLWPPVVAGVDDQGAAYLEGSCDPGPQDGLPRTLELLEASPSNPRLFTQPAESMKGDRLPLWSHQIGSALHPTNRGQAANAF
jgi:hypothetical protein